MKFFIKAIVGFMVITVVLKAFIALGLIAAFYILAKLSKA